MSIRGGYGSFTNFGLLMEGNVFCWNCRRARSREFLAEMKDWKRIHNPMKIVLLEPKISGAGANEVCKKLRKTHWVHFEVDRFSGGVVALEGSRH